MWERIKSAFVASENGTAPWERWIDPPTQALWRRRWRRFLAGTKRVTRSRLFGNAIIALIVVNAALLGLETDQSFAETNGAWMDVLDRLILAIFTLEILMRVLTYGRAFFRDGWSWFDLTVVAVSYAPAFAGLAALRIFRIFRLFRLFSVVPKMRRVIEGFFAALPGMAGVMGVLALIFYVSAVITTTVFGQADFSELPEGVTVDDVAAVQALYGSLDRSFFTLFQLMTLEDWAGGIVGPTMKVFPNAMIFFIPYIVITSFAVLNLFIGIIVDAMQDDREHEAEIGRQEEAAKARQDRAEDLAREDRRFDEVLAELRELKGQLAALTETQADQTVARR